VVPSGTMSYITSAKESYTITFEHDPAMPFSTIELPFSRQTHRAETAAASIHIKITSA